MDARQERDNTRSSIAFRVLGVGMLALVAVSLAALFLTPETGCSEMAKMVFASIVPLLGTWIGTVLTFYFARENLAASATTINTMNAARGVSDETSVQALMVPFDKIQPPHTEQKDRDAKDLKLRVIPEDNLQRYDQSRMPVFRAAGVALCVLHDFEIDKYCAAKGKLPDKFDATDTLGELLSVPADKARMELMAFVPVTATVKDARDKLTDVPGWKDVFVTKSGAASEKVLGWITSSDLARYS
jgi:hypothetical protein